MKNILILGAAAITILTILFFVLDGKKTDTKDVKSAVNQEIEVPKTDAVVPEQTTEKQIEVNEGATDLARRIAPEDTPAPVPLSKLKVANFSGTLEKVDVGCFADGECYVEVDGKHVTAIMGWSQQTVGQVLGVDGFGDLENHIGKQVEVYAQDTSDGKYTLYGNEGFYIKLK